VKGRALSALLLASLVALAASSADADTSKNYDPGRTHDCFVKRPDYRPLNWYIGKPGTTAPATAFQLLDDGRRTGFPFHGGLPAYGTTIGSGHNYGVSFARMNFEIVWLTFFERTAYARAMYHQFLAKRDPAFVPQVKETYVVVRNIFINWGTPYTPPPARVRSIVLGCLRTAW
jgi:hypothetical protein